MQPSPRPKDKSKFATERTTTTPSESRTSLGTSTTKSDTTTAPTAPRSAQSTRVTENTNPAPCAMMTTKGALSQHGMALLTKLEQSPLERMYHKQQDDSRARVLCNFFKAYTDLTTCHEPLPSVGFAAVDLERAMHPSGPQVSGAATFDPSDGSRAGIVTTKYGIRLVSPRKSFTLGKSSQWNAQRTGLRQSSKLSLACHALFG